MRSKPLSFSITLMLLMWIAVGSALGTIKGSVFDSAEKWVHLAVAIVFWSFIISRFYRSPLKWSLRVSMLMILMIAFQNGLWLQAVDDPELAVTIDRNAWLRFLGEELTLFVTAVMALIVRRDLHRNQ